MPNTVDRVEVFAGIQRRRQYSVEQKLAAVAEAAQPGMSISFVARKFGYRSVCAVFHRSVGPVSPDPARAEASEGIGSAHG